MVHGADGLCQMSPPPGWTLRSGRHLLGHSSAKQAVRNVCSWGPAGACSVAGPDLLGFALLTKFAAHHPVTCPCPCPRPKVSLLRSPEITPTTSHAENCLHTPRLFQHILECKLVILLQGDIAVTSSSSKKRKRAGRAAKPSSVLAACCDEASQLTQKQSFFFPFHGSSQSPCLDLR